MLKIESLEDLEKLLAVCHKQAVHAIEVDGIKLNLTPRDPEAKPMPRQPDPLDALSNLTEEEIALWSSTPQ